MICLAPNTETVVVAEFDRKRENIHVEIRRTDGTPTVVDTVQRVEWGENERVFLSEKGLTRRFDLPGYVPVHVPLGGVRRVLIGEKSIAKDTTR